MKKANKAQGPREYTEYDFSVGVRGKYSAREPAPSDAVTVRVWAPLAEFRWHGVERRLTDDVWLRPGSSYTGYEREAFAQFLSEEERNECRDTGHWLNMVRFPHQELTARASINIFLIALWIAKPTLTHMAMRFEETDAGVFTAARVLERVRWIEGYAAKEINDDDLDLVERIMLPLREIYLARGRLKNALVLTFRGCVSSEWQSALICYASAAEALLAHSRDRGVVGRLAKTYGRLAGRSERRRDEAEAQFRRLYAIRSDIVHGRAFDRPANVWREMTESGLHSSRGGSVVP
jgi:hypothetical protein